MLSYQHAYHAGNLADLHKHTFLAGYLRELATRAKPRSRLRYIDTHAGRGAYDLASAEALTTGDAARGIGRVRVDALPSALGRAVLATRRRLGPNAYPGSPEIARESLRAHDDLWLFERHPTEHAALARWARGRAAVEHVDGPARLLEVAAAQPCVPGLILVDPSYELRDEMAATARFVEALLERWREAAVLVWYPLLPAAVGKDARRLHEPLAHLNAFRHEVRFQPQPALGQGQPEAASVRTGRHLGLEGSGILLFNAKCACEPLAKAAADLLAHALRK
jgi:23S rRNA (adenine2030-N6)-methyltransferase